jgi:hypothetical protein
MGHCADTAILRTSRQVHREAYDYMMKTNRFILVRTTTPLPLTTILACAGDAITVISKKEKCKLVRGSSINDVDCVVCVFYGCVPDAGYIHGVVD